MLRNEQMNENDAPGGTRTRTRSKGLYLQTSSQGRTLKDVLRDTQSSTNNIHRALSPASVPRRKSPFSTKKSQSSASTPSLTVHAPTAPSQSTLSIGRGSHVDIDLGRQYKQISRRHLVITRSKHGQFLMSIEGANGATVDGLNHISGTSDIALRHESVVEVGDARFIFHVDKVNRPNEVKDFAGSEGNFRNENAETEETCKTNESHQVARLSSPFSSDATPRRRDHIPIPHKKRKCGYYSLSSEDPRSDGAEPSSGFTATTGAPATPLRDNRSQRKASLPMPAATTPVTEPYRPMSDAYNDNYFVRRDKNLHPASTPSRADVTRRAVRQDFSIPAPCSIAESSLTLAEDLDMENNENEVNEVDGDEKLSSDREEERENVLSSSSTSSARQGSRYRHEPAKSREKGVEVRYSREAEELKAAAAAIKFTVSKLPVTTSTVVEKGKIDKKRRNGEDLRMDGNERLGDADSRRGETERKGNEEGTSRSSIAVDDNARRGRTPPSPTSLSIKLQALAKDANHTPRHSRQTSLDIDVDDETQTTFVNDEVKGTDRCRKNASSVRSSSLSPLSSVPSCMMFTDSELESDMASDDTDNDEDGEVCDSDMPLGKEDNMDVSDLPLKAKKKTRTRSSKALKRSSSYERKTNDKSTTRSTSPNQDNRRPPGGPYNYPALVADALVFSGKRSLTISDVLDEVAHSIPSVRFDPSVWRHQISKTLFSAPFFVRVERSGKDATGKHREDLWHYDINADPDEGRRENYAEVAKGARSCTLVDKQYYWKPVPRLPNWKGGKGWSNSGSDHSRRKKTVSSGSKKNMKSRMDASGTILEEEKQEGEEGVEDDGLEGEEDMEVDDWDSTVRPTRRNGIHASAAELD